MTTTTMHIEHEVVVLGGGPAGSAAATLLARRGHDVALVRPATPIAGALAQSIPPSAHKLLAELDVLAPRERTGFHRNCGNTVWWASAEPRIETFPEWQWGFHVDRAAFESGMVAVARESGVHVYASMARAVENPSGGWAVHCGTHGGSIAELRAPWILDATGRRGLIARGEGREPDRSTTTLALIRRWRRRGGFEGVQPTHTLVETYRDGWAWSVPLDPDVRSFTAMVDPRHVKLSGMDLDAALDAELDKARAVGSSRAGATPLGRAWACPASLYTSARFGRQGLLLVGDAGSFIDPLSSFGVKKALSSGWLAAAAVHTALRDASMTDSAVRFFDARERDVYRQYRARSVEFFEAGADAYDHEYWRTRAEAARIAGQKAGTGPIDPDTFEDESGASAAEARVALQRIRERPTLDAVRGSSVRLVKRPTVVGNRIVLAEHLASDRAPWGLRYVRNVDLCRVLDVSVRHPDVPGGWAAYNEGPSRVTLPDYLAALASAFAAGLLEHEPPSPQGR